MCLGLGEGWGRGGGYHTTSVGDQPGLSESRGSLNRKITGNLGGLATADSTTGLVYRDVYRG